MRRTFFGAVAVAAVALTVVFTGSAGAAKSPPPAPTGNCPSTLTGWKSSNAVDAYSTGTAPGTMTYYFSSLTNEGASAGLVGYCVYTNGVLSGTTVTPPNWKTDHNGGNASFVRGNGDKSNIPLDGTTGIQIGTGTFTSAVTTQTILLHINDATECNNIYGGNPGTCYVLPKTGNPPDLCTIGDTTVGYNAIPFGIVHCAAGGEGFEANGDNEFGDLVALNTAGGNKIQSMTVDFQSYGCGTSGHWYTALPNPPSQPLAEPCVTNFGDTFLVPGGITAKIYAVGAGGAVGALLATSTANTDPILYRPSASAQCTGADVGKWFDTVDQKCHNSYSVPLSFNFPGHEPLPSSVIWTVSFNTTHAGYNPIGENTTCFQAVKADQTMPGCGYDSLNVGSKTYSANAFSGTDVNEDTAYRSYTPNYTPPVVPLAAEGGWTTFRPLGEIILGP